MIESDHFLDRVKTFLRKLNQVELGLRSASLAFHTVLALLPIIGLLFWYLYRVGVTQKWLEQLKQFILSHLSLGTNTNFIAGFEKLSDSIRVESWGTLGILILFFSFWSLITKFGASLDYVLKVRSPDETPLTLGFMRLTLRRTFVMLLLPIVPLLSFVVINWIREDSWLNKIWGAQISGPTFVLPLTWAVDIFLLSLIYYFIPRKRVTYRRSLFASFVVVVGIELSKFLIGHYNEYAITVHKIYGIFVTVPLTILWIQLFWALLLAGGLLLVPLQVSRKRGRK